MRSMTKTITVSAEVWKALDKMGSTSDSWDSVIRRLIKEAGKANLLEESEEEIRSGTDLITALGERIPNNTELKAIHKGVEYRAIVKNGRIVVGEDRFLSPSMAARKITGYNINGWHFWEAKDESGEWKTIVVLRELWQEMIIK